MSTATADQRSTDGGPPAAGGGLPEASLAESLQFVATGLLPSVLRGLFAPRRWAMKALTRANSDARAIKVLSEIRRKHGGEGVRLLGGRIVTLWGVDAIKEVLDRSAEIYDAGSGAKGKGMSHFQPDAATLSHGEEWKDRRAFNESVLATSERIHPDAERFLVVVADEVARLRVGPGMEWVDFERLFDHITLRIIFGDRSRGDKELTDLLEKLMGEANRIVGLKQTDDYYELYSRLERKLADPEPDSLIARIAGAPQTDRTRVTHQIPHWMFAMRDTLAANAYRALAAIVADPSVMRKAREEIEGKDLSDPATFEGLEYLEGCFQEAMRLWPTTPLLAREAMKDTTLAGQKVDDGAQVMILNAFNHRDRERIPDADLFNPHRWEGGARDYRFNHLSNGSQDCPGGPMVLLIGKAVLARMLDEYELGLEAPELKQPLPEMLDFFDIRFKAQVAGTPTPV
jgi:cytochrome P450